MKGGIDFGSRNCTIAIAKGKIEVIQNEVSSRQTAGCVGYSFKKRELGEAGLDQVVRNARNTVYGVKLLLGRKYDDEEFRKQLSRLGACKWVPMNNGNLGVEVEYLGNPVRLTAEQVNGSLFTKLKKTVEAATSAQLQYCVVSVPGFWSHTQRRACLNATKIAGLNVIKIINELSAVAFNYGFYHPQQFPKPEYIMFIDMGYSAFSCGVFEMTNPSCKNVSAAYDQALGGADIDDILANYFAARFNKKYNTCLQDNVKAWMKLLLAVEKVKKTLNMNEKATISMDCLHEDRDLQDTITRAEYLEMLNAARIPERVVECVKKALDLANISIDQLHSVEAVGSSTRVQAIRTAIETYLNKPLGSKMNAEEAVAIGCALFCARHSPASSTRAYDLIENTGTSVVASWKTLGDPNDTKVTDMEIFPSNYLLPKTKTRNVTLNRVDAKPFEIAIHQKSDFCIYGNNVIATCQVPKILKDNEMLKDVRVVVKLKAEPIGTFHFGDVEMQEDKEEIVDVPIEPEKPAESPKPEGEEKPAESSEPAKDDEMKAETPEQPKTRQERRKVVVCTKIGHTVLTPNELTDEQVSAFKKQEADMTAQDELVIATANSKNELETMVYAAGEKVSGVWKDFGTRQEKDAIEELAGQITIWLYDDGADVAKAEYDSRLKSLGALCDKLSIRQREWEEVPAALDALVSTIAALRNEANSKDEKYAHIAPEEMQKVITQCDDAQKYIDDKQPQYQARQKTQDPVFFASDLKMRIENLNINCKKILNTPKPAPKKEEPKKEEPKKDEPPKEEKKEQEPGEEKKDDNVHMDTDVD